MSSSERATVSTLLALGGNTDVPRNMTNKIGKESPFLFCSLEFVLSRRRLMRYANIVAQTLKPFLQRTISQSRLYTLISHLYYKLLLNLHSYSYKITIDDAEALFSIESVAELKRLHSLGGEEDILTDLVSSLTPQDVFYDVGANIGIYTCLAASVLPPECVVAFEPHPENCDRLRRNIRVNGYAVEIIQAALSDNTGLGHLYEWSREPSEGGHHLVAGQRESTVAVDVIEGDEVKEKWDVPGPTVIKIDVEGAELRVLKGLQRTLNRLSCRLCYCEIHLTKADTDELLKDIVHIFEGAGFQVKILNSVREKECFVRAWKER